MKAELSKDLARLWRAESARLHAALMWQCRDLSLAEDALQDAFLQACKQWPREGLPANPVAWMHSVAKRRLIDRLRQSRVRQTSQADSSLQLQVEWRNSRCPPNAAIPDDRLRLIFTCCHPALSREAQIALTLKIVCGLSSAEIARAFVVSADTLDRRLSRAKQKIALAGIAYEVPEGEALKRRLPEVLAVIYLLFNESFQATEGPSLSRENLALEAIRLGRLLFELQPSAEAGGLLALMELHWARASARRGDQRGFIPLEEQDRSRWDHATIS
ncbi:MAG: RNA polymerase sigma factor, partial [Granulosicoccaceae bacterium]